MPKKLSKKKTAADEAKQPEQPMGADPAANFTGGNVITQIVSGPAITPPPWLGRGAC